jgi:hypothetical protein
MALSRLTLLALALAACASSAEKRMRAKPPTDAHQAAMKTRLAEAAHHVQHGGPRDEKLHRVRGLIELHGGFVTDMLAEYRPSLMANWVAKVRSFINPAQTALFSCGSETDGRGPRTS